MATSSDQDLQSMGTAESTTDTAMEQMATGSDQYQETINTAEDSSDAAEETAQILTDIDLEFDGMDIEGFLSIARTFRSGDMEAVIDTVNSQNNLWKDIPLNICVIGTSGSGKSTLINALRDLSDDDPLSAHVDVEECTKKCTPYKYPNNDNFILWDVPGVGTKNFPKETYLEKIDFQKYDFFLICSHCRFSENDLWVAEQIQKAQKTFYMLRTMIDFDVQNEKRRRRQFSEENVLQKIRSTYKTALPSDCHLFLVSSHFPEKWDFQSLQEKMISDTPSKKREAIIFSLAAHTEKIVEEKKQTLRSRINKAAWIAAANGAVLPFPSLSADCQIPLIEREAKFFRTQLCLNDEFLSRKAGELGMTRDQLVNEVGMCFSFDVTKTVEETNLEDMAKRKYDFTDKYVLPFIPLVGHFVGAVRWYNLANHMLHSILDQLCDDAIKFVKYLSEAETSDN